MCGSQLGFRHDKGLLVTPQSACLQEEKGKPQETRSTVLTQHQIPAGKSAAMFRSQQAQAWGLGMGTVNGNNRRYKRQKPFPHHSSSKKPGHAWLQCEQPTPKRGGDTLPISALSPEVCAPTSPRGPQSVSRPQCLRGSWWQ